MFDIVLQERDYLSTVIIQELVDAGFHFGHRTSRWNPKMKPLSLVNVI